MSRALKVIDRLMAALAIGLIVFLIGWKFPVIGY
jgi:hypothetical protein